MVILNRKSGDWFEGFSGRYKIQALKFSESSQHGINNGKISKLWIYDIKESRQVLNYDRGWDVELDENSPKELKELYNQIIKKYN